MKAISKHEKSERVNDIVVQQKSSEEITVGCLCFLFAPSGERFCRLRSNETLVQ